MTTKKQRSITCRCKDCGAPSDQRALCGKCNPHKATSKHWDKYSDKRPA